MDSPRLDLQSPDTETLLITLSGQWRIVSQLPSSATAIDTIRGNPNTRRIAFSTDGVCDWDSGLATFLIRIIDYCTAQGLEVDPAGLPDGVSDLLRLAHAVPEQVDTRREPIPASLSARVGQSVLELSQSIGRSMTFVGEVTQALGKLFVGQAQFRRADFALVVQRSGAQALPIVTLISFLVGLILAFIGAVTLKQFGAQIYIADLVGLGMSREMSATMVGVIMAGRTGAAFAAQLGTMVVNEEIDALKTTGISPMEFLVLPRMLALSLMMPLLCLYADLMGILGGFFVGVTMLNLEPQTYLIETQSMLGIVDFVLGLIKSAVYGVLIAFAGCYHGMHCGQSASAVGEAATNAVVSSIVLIVVSSSILTVLYDVLGY